MSYYEIKKMALRRNILSCLLLVAFVVIGQSQAMAAAKHLTSFEYASLPGAKLQFEMGFDAQAISPKAFQTDNPARLVLDFPGALSGLKKKQIKVNTGVVTHVSVVEAAGRTRVVFNLLKPVRFDVDTEQSKVVLTLNSKKSIKKDDAVYPSSKAAGGEITAAALPPQSIENIDFRRGTKGEGRILITLGDPNTIVNMREEGGRVVLVFADTLLPKRLAKQFDVSDFATPVKAIEATTDGRGTKVTIVPGTTDYDYLSYQSDKNLTIEVRPLTKAEKEVQKKKAFKYEGERLSLNFQDIDIRSVLQVLADFTNQNMVASDTVKGKITLRLSDVPWDQALAVVLKSKDLAMRKEGNVILVAPSAEINKMEKSELEALATKEKLEPLRTEIIQINYADAQQVAAVLTGVQSSNQSANNANSTTPAYVPETSIYDNGGGSVASGSVMSERGTVTIDDRTNVLIVKDTSRNLEAIRKLVDQLDKPVRQVLIESRVVIATDDFTRELGVRFGANGRNFTPGDGSEKGFDVGGASTNGLISDLPAAVGLGSGGALGLTIFKVGSFLLNLELSALQVENRGEVLSSPRVITSDKTRARIEQGVEIPYATVSLEGTSTQFKKAVLALEVLPHITPDNQIVMELKITKDTRGALTPDGIAIDTREIETTVQVANGETIVLGGIYENTKSRTVNKIPILGDLPGIGFLFRKTNVTDDKKELLIFITPKVLDEKLTDI
ncbi:MAG: type IV pilus secretin PilQ [Methylococcales bacterium]